jgi:hypothetical protein
VAEQYNKAQTFGLSFTGLPFKKKGMKGKEKHTISGAKINVLHVSNAVKFKSFLTIFILSV